MLSLTDALGIVTRQSQANVDPAVSPADVTDILTRSVRYTVWAANTLYAYGQRVTPSVGNGHLYRAVSQNLPGTLPISGTTEPMWVAIPLYATMSGAYASRPYGRDSPHASGYYLPDGGVIWQEDGPAPSEMYDVRSATYQVLLEKMALVSGDYQFRVGGREGVEEHPQMVIDNLLKLAAKYAPFGL